MRRALALVAVLLLAGCSDPEPTNVPPNQNVKNLPSNAQLYVQNIEVNGRTVACVIFEGTRKGGVSCDFGTTVTR